MWAIELIVLEVMNIMNLIHELIKKLIADNVDHAIGCINRNILIP